MLPDDGNRQAVKFSWRPGTPLPQLAIACELRCACDSLSWIATRSRTGHRADCLARTIGRLRAFAFRLQQPCGEAAQGAALRRVQLWWPDPALGRTATSAGSPCALNREFPLPDLRCARAVGGGTGRVASLAVRCSTLWIH